MTDNELQLVRDRYREIQSEKELLQETEQMFAKERRRKHGLLKRDNRSIKATN